MWRKYTHCLSMGKSLRAAEFWQVTLQRPWQGQSSSKGRGRIWQGRLPSLPISDKRTKAHLAFSTIQSSTRSCYKLKAPATQTVFKTGSQFIFMKDLSIWLGAMLQTPRSAWWEAASMLYRKEKPTPWHARGLPSLPWACFFSSMVHISTRTPAGESCCASLIYTIKLAKTCLSFMLF